LIVKLLRRVAQFEDRSMVAGAPVGQTKKLNIPKKTKVFVDQTIREREEAVNMHQVRCAE
jgi:Bardet-Biedl syndrome 1 protein